MPLPMTLPMKAISQRLGHRLHYAWIVAAVIFLACLVSAGIRSMPGVLLVPLDDDFGWGRPTISFAISVGIALYGLVGPFAAAIMDRFGIRRTVLAALLLLALAVAGTTVATRPWEMVLTMGVLSGVGTGTVANVLGAVVVARWFRAHRGLAMGLMTAATATGQLVFLPAMAAGIEAIGWRASSLIVAAVTLLVIPIVFLLAAERPSSVALGPLGATTDEPARRPAGNPFANAFLTLGRGLPSPTFWLLSASFFVCGLSTNGLVGVHLIPLCLDHGIPEVKGAGLLAGMGIFNLVGTTASGWLSDRFDNRLLLACYYGLRGLSLLFLPFSDFSFAELSIFAVFFGLDWIATVPPTVRLATDAFGEKAAPILYGWILAGHQVGAAVAAYGAGLMRSELATYLVAFLVAGAACVMIAFTLLGSAYNQRKAALASAAE
jgi:MFS family permease